MRRFGLALALVAALGGVASGNAAPAGALTASWTDGATSRTLVVETCKSISGPSPYTAECTWTAVADSTITASPQRGSCSEVLATVGERRILAPCKAEFSVKMKLVRTSRSNDGVWVCNGTTRTSSRRGRSRFRSRAASPIETVTACLARWTSMLKSSQIPSLSPVLTYVSA